LKISKRPIKMGQGFLPLVEALNNKRPSINRFALQIEDIPVYIIYHRVNQKTTNLTIQDVGNTKSKTIKIDIDDSITHFMFLLSLIRDEYKQGYLFTDKSHLHD
jgi:hypothetical protein